MTTLSDNYNGGARQLHWSLLAGSTMFDQTADSLALGYGHGATVFDQYEYVTDTLASPVHYIQENFTIQTDASTDGFGGVIGRVNPGSQNWYLGGIGSSGGYTTSNGFLFLSRFVGNVETGLASVAPPANLVAGAVHLVRLEITTVSGNVFLELFWDGVSRLTFTDSSGSKLTTGNLVGHGAAANTPTFVEVDNFQAGDIVAGGGAGLFVPRITAVY
jgi:hypothetical protein